MDYVQDEMPLANHKDWENYVQAFANVHSCETQNEGKNACKHDEPIESHFKWIVFWFAAMKYHYIAGQVLHQETLKQY